jgi:hypothetical protein
MKAKASNRNYTTAPEKLPEFVSVPEKDTWALGFLASTDRTITPGVGSVQKPRQPLVCLWHLDISGIT